MTIKFESVLTEIGPGSRPPFLLYLCACGKQKEIRKYDVQDGKTGSCGCVNRKMAAERKTKHGMCESAAYLAWCGMKTRVTNKKRKDYKNYGGRGIEICVRWLDADRGFANFYEDMGDPPSEKHSLDRYPDINGNYEPGNCRWADSFQQAQGRRSTKFYTYDGRTLCRSDWARELGISDRSLKERIIKWGVEAALSVPKLEAGWNGYKARQVRVE